MAEDAKKKYRLYVLPLDQKCIDVASKERFYRASPRYVLIYTAGEIKLPHAEITQDELHRLSTGEANWLRDCNLVLLAEAARENEESIAEDLSKRLDRLEAALKKEKEKVKE